MAHVSLFLFDNLTKMKAPRTFYYVRSLISISGMVIIKILRLFSYSGHSLKFKNLEIGLYPTQELYLR